MSFDESKDIEALENQTEYTLFRVLVEKNMLAKETRLEVTKKLLNLFLILNSLWIILTNPITFARGEGSFSKQKHIKNVLGNAMTQKW